MRAPAILCVLAIAVGGCGAASSDSAKDFKGEKRAVATTIESLESAARKNDATKVCTQLFSDSLLAALKKKGTNCTTAVKQAFKDADSLDITVKDVTISGQTATAKVTSGSAGSSRRNDTMQLVHDASAWKISSGF